jgi:hypothetical protein
MAKKTEQGAAEQKKDERKEPGAGQKQQERLKEEREIVREILREASKRAAQLKLWTERTGLDDRRSDRRKREVVNGR